MQPTRRCWTVAAVGSLLAIAGVVFVQPVLVVGAAGVGAWVLTQQIRFVRAVTRADAALTVDQTVTPERVATDRPALARVTARLARPVGVDVEVAVTPPTGVRRREPTAAPATIAAGGTAVGTTLAVDAPVAGAFTFDPATITFTGDRGLFTETVRRGATATLTVVPRAPRNVHVGQGGEQFATVYGEHDVERAGPGMEPAELREYVPGDAARRIDWKATARLDEPHVRMYEAATDRTTALVVDHRAAMAAGPDGETKLDYARAVALGVVDSARDLGDPVGLYGIGDGGLTTRTLPEATEDAYADLQATLYDLEPTGTTHGSDRGDPARVRSRSPSSARAAADRLRDDTSAFATTVRPYYAAVTTYVTRIDDDPLFHTVRTHIARIRGTLWTAIFTDDTAPAEVREAVKVARRGENHVLVFMTPSVLFDEAGRTAPDRAYDRYRAFEQFRRDLDRLDRVTAFEIGPGDRLDAVLEARRRTRGVA